jgi:hypothetical protein
MDYFVLTRLQLCENLEDPLRIDLNNISGATATRNIFFRNPIARIGKADVDLIRRQKNYTKSTVDQRGQLS